MRELDRARALLQSGDPAGASRLLLPLAARDARNFPLLCTLGAAHQAAGAFDAAIEAYRRAAALRPDYGLSHSGLAGALRARAASLDGAAPGAPGRARDSAAQAQADALRLEAAGEYEKALALDPRSSDDYLAYAELELERSRPGPARAVLERADRADALDPELALLAGRLAFAAGDARRAEALYARALELAPTVATARTLGAIRLDALDDPAGALAAFRRALELARGGPEARELEELLRELEAPR